MIDKKDGLSFINMPPNYHQVVIDQAKMIEEQSEQLKKAMHLLSLSRAKSNVPLDKWKRLFKELEGEKE